MRKEKFLELVKNPVHDQDTSEDELSSLIRQFPYSQPLRILYLRKLHENNSVQYATQLKITAAYAPDRARLYNLILGKPEEEIFPSLMELEGIAEALPVTEITNDEIKPTVSANDQEIINQESEIKIPELNEPVLSNENIINDKKVEEVFHEINSENNKSENSIEENISEDQSDELTPQQIIDLRLRELGIWTEPAPSHDFSSVESLNLKEEFSTEDIQPAVDEIVFEDVSNIIQPVIIPDAVEDYKDELTSASTPEETDTPVFEIQDIHIDNTETDLRYVENSPEENINTEVEYSEISEFDSDKISPEDESVINNEEEETQEEEIEVDEAEFEEDIDEEDEENTIPDYSYSGTIRNSDETSKESDSDPVNRLILENLVENSYFPAVENQDTASDDISKNEKITAASENILSGEIHSFTEWLKLKKKTTVIEQVNLKSALNDQPETVNKPQDNPEVVEPVKTSTPVFNEPLSEPRLIYSREEKSDTSEEAQISSSEPEQNSGPATDPLPPAPVPRNRASEIIEKFIEQEPRISPAKSTFYSPVNMARKSVQEPDDLITETLARIYAQQGNFKKAIDIYEKMALKFPEKRRYFAALIEDLNNKSNS